jgi:hypothetical protein
MRDVGQKIPLGLCLFSPDGFVFLLLLVSTTILGRLRQYSVTCQIQRARRAQVFIKADICIYTHKRVYIIIHIGCFKKSFTTLKESTEDIHNVLNCHNVAKHCKFVARSTVVPSTATSSAHAFEIWTCSVLEEVRE